MAGEDARCGGVSPDSGAFSHCQRGMPGKEKIAFESIVQGVYFRRILQAANLRLQDMTEGRYLLLHAEKAMNKRSQAGLELEVLEHYTVKAARCVHFRVGKRLRLRFPWHWGFPM